MLLNHTSQYVRVQLHTTNSEHFIFCSVMYFFLLPTTTWSLPFVLAHSENLTQLLSTHAWKVPRPLFRDMTPTPTCPCPSDLQIFPPEPTIKKITILHHIPWTHTNHEKTRQVSNITYKELLLPFNRELGWMVIKVVTLLKLLMLSCLKKHVPNA